MISILKDIINFIFFRFWKQGMTQGRRGRLTTNEFLEIEFYSTNFDEIHFLLLFLGEVALFGRFAGKVAA